VVESKNRKNNSTCVQKEKNQLLQQKQNTAPDGRETKEQRKQQLTCYSHAFQCLGVLQCFPMPSGVFPHLLGVPMTSSVPSHTGMPAS